MELQPRSASSFVLTTLRTYADRELRIADLIDLAKGRFTDGNISKAVYFLHANGLIVRTKDGGVAWWAVSAKGLVLR